MTEMRELKTEIEMPELTIDERPHELPTMRMQGRWHLDALGRYWTPAELLTLAACIAGATAALWAWLAGR